MSITEYKIVEKFSFSDQVSGLYIMEEYEKAMKQKQLKENEMNQLRWEEARSDLNTRNKIVKGNN